jgi:hypothetical protein
MSMERADRGGSDCHHRTRKLQVRRPPRVLDGDGDNLMVRFKQGAKKLRSTYVMLINTAPRAGT